MHPKRLLGVITACALALTGCGSSIHQTAGGSVHPPGWGRPPSIAFTAPNPGPTREMFDSVTVAKPPFPGSVAAAAGYTAGHWPTYLGLVRLFPHAIVKSIAISAAFHAMCLDVEPGDATPSQVVAWVRADIAAGFHKPCLYSSYWEFVNQVRPALAAGHIARSSVWEWDANFTHVRHLDAGFDATQWTDKAFGRNLDESVVTLAFLGIHPRPVLPVCLAHRIRPQDCLKAKAQLQLDRQAASVSRRALVRVDRTLSTNHCRSPWRRGVCVRAGRARRLALHRITYLQRAVAAIEAVS